MCDLNSAYILSIDSSMFYPDGPGGELLWAVRWIFAGRFHDQVVDNQQNDCPYN